MLAITKTSTKPMSSLWCCQLKRSLLHYKAILHSKDGFCLQMVVIVYKMVSLCNLARWKMAGYLIGDLYVHYWTDFKIYISFCSLHYWRPQVGWYWSLCQPGSCGSVQQWSMGNCVWWSLEQCGCKCGLQTTGLLWKRLEFYIFVFVIVVVRLFFTIA